MWIKSGRFYQRTADDRLEETTPGPADVWTCRRLADFPGARVPAGGAVGACERCQAPIVFKPAPPVTFAPDVARICMQCAGIMPGPMPADS